MEYSKADTKRTTPEQRAVGVLTACGIDYTSAPNLVWAISKAIGEAENEAAAVVGPNSAMLRPVSSRI